MQGHTQTILRIAAAALCLASSVNAAPASPHNLQARRLLGSSFGVPGNATFDYVVVGAGNAGIGLAYRLAEGGHSVALVEAGSFYEIGNGNLTQIPGTDVFFAGKDPSDTNNLIDWNFVTQPQAGLNNASTHYARGKCLGGNTARNYMTYQIATADSYQMWADQVGDQSYTYQNFLPYFKKSIQFTAPNQNTRLANSTPQYDASTMGNSGPVSVSFPNTPMAWASWAAKGWTELGLKAISGFTSGNLLGYSYILATIEPTTQTRETSETGYLQPALQKLSNLYVFQSTLAKKVLFDSNKAATGVVVDSAGEVYTLTANKEVIVSAGSFQSPQLLMVSGIGPAATLQKHNIPVLANRPGVGQNMQDHILSGPAYRVNLITGSSVSIPSYFAQSVAAFNSNPPTGLLTNPGCDLIAWEKVPQSLRSNFTQQAQSDLAKYPADWPEVEYLGVGGYFGYQQNFVRDAPNDGYNYVTMASALVAPLSRGTVDISSADTSDLPLVNPNWLTHPTDVQVAVAGFKRARQLMATKSVAPIIIGKEYFPGASVQSDSDIIAWLRKATNTVFHAACTCAMGQTNDTNAVIDSQARVIGVSKLRVVDASSLPFLPPGHPMSSIYALAEKIADAMLNGH